MAFQPAPEVALAEILYTLDLQECENTMHFFRPGGWDGASLSNLASALASWAEDNIMPLLSFQVDLRAVRVTDISTQVTPSVQFDFSPVVPGGNVSGSLPNNCAFCVTSRTPFRGRSARGRNYILGIPELAASQSLVSEPFAAAIIAAYNLLPGIGGALLSTPCVLSRFSNNAARPAGVPFQITGYEARDRVIDSQRRRTPGRGS